MDSARRRSSARVLRCLLGVMAGGLVLSVLPAPGFEFVAAASASTDPVAAFEPADAAAVAAMQAASDVPLGEDRHTGGDADVDTFELLGVTLSDAPSEPILVRVRDDEGWGEWNVLEHEGDMGPDAATEESASLGDAADRFATDPIWVGDALGYEISVGPDDADDVEVELVR